MDIEKLNHPNAKAELKVARLESARAAVEQAQFQLDHAQTDTDRKIWKMRLEGRKKDLQSIEDEEIAEIAA